MPSIRIGNTENLTSSSRNSSIYTWPGGSGTLAVQGDLDGGSVYLYVAIDPDEENTANFAQFSDQSGTVLTLGSTTGATQMRAITVDMPRCNYYIGVLGGTSPDVDVSFTMVNNRRMQ